jgi:hypothetical protein
MARQAAAQIVQELMEEAEATLTTGREVIRRVRKTSHWFRNDRADTPVSVAL